MRKFFSCIGISCEDLKYIRSLPPHKIKDEIDFHIQQVKNKIDYLASEMCWYFKGGMQRSYLTSIPLPSFWRIIEHAGKISKKHYGSTHG